MSILSFISLYTSVRSTPPGDFANIRGTVISLTHKRVRFKESSASWSNVFPYVVAVLSRLSIGVIGVTYRLPIQRNNKKAPDWEPFCSWSGQRDSDPRSQPWQGCALPTKLCPHAFHRGGQRVENIQERWRTCKLRRVASCTSSCAFDLLTGQMQSYGMRFPAHQNTISAMSSNST